MNWVIFSVLTDVAVIVIPEEAEKLLRLLRGVENSPTHLLAYAAPVTRKMLHFNNFTYYSVPPLPKDWEAPIWFRIELGIFAGRLYFPYLEYPYLLQYLGIKTNDLELEGKVEGPGPEACSADATHKEAGIYATRPDIKAFSRKPLSFLQEWLSIRRKGQDFAHTPMGFVCQGKPLLASHPFFTRPETDGERQRPLPVGGSVIAVDNEVDDDIEQDFCDDTYGGEVGIDEKDSFDDLQLKLEDYDDDTESDY